MKSQLILFSLLFLFTVSTSKVQGQAEDNWMQWRGPLGNGVAVKANPPVDFSETKNLKWKTAIPGRGNATPIVYEDKIIILTAVPTDSSVDPQVSPNVEHNFNVILVNRNDGSIIWEKTIATDLPQGKIHELSSWASNSPCTDGEMIYAYFGSFGLYCLDFDGNIIWKRDFGTMEKRMNFGDGASPYLYKDRLFIQWDHEDDSWIYCVDKKNGNDIWKMERDEPTSWSTPFVVEANGKTQVITSATTEIRSYDYENGNVLWSSTGMTGNVIPVPMVENNLLYVTSGFRGAALQAIDLTKASGDITGTDAIIWEYNQDTPYTPCALLMDGKLYFLRANNGVLTCLDAKDGSVNYSKERLEGISTIFSSPSGADGKIYIAAKGICLVIKAGETFEILNSNKLDDDFHASPVFVDKQLILRGFESLYCFEE
ncbi:PQQ-binding-like beta-propeller repeat protein [Draconibacterium orientale]|uniref:outer membrane protein assembly factor BamB family protein n=1 Tax=Draconibacterium orientale TaxID=1168034 RepID=UPI002A0A8EC8|nr:PQQ-binding-like beta-propeller repeat protein [Draconibacterium orientale]